MVIFHKGTKITIICAIILFFNSTNIQSSPTTLRDAEQFDNEVLGNNSPAIVMFSATWCTPCQAVKPLYMQAQSSRIRFYIADYNNLQSIIVRYAIEAMPTFLFIVNGDIVAKIDEGMVVPAKFFQRLDEHIRANFPTLGSQSLKPQPRKTRRMQKTPRSTKPKNIKAPKIKKKIRKQKTSKSTKRTTTKTPKIKQRHKTSRKIKKIKRKKYSPCT